MLDSGQSCVLFDLDQVERALLKRDKRRDSKKPEG
jgi:hypothetical protein